MKKGTALALALACLICLFGCGKETDQADVVVGGDLIPQVMVDGVIYVDMNTESTAPDRADGFDGEITSAVVQSQQPTENDQSNFGTGYGYRFGEREGTLELYMNGKWWLFATEEVRHQIQFPEQHMVVDCPPDLIVNYGDQSVKARQCLINWEFTM